MWVSDTGSQKRMEIVVWSGRKGGRTVLWPLEGLGGVHDSLGAELAEVLDNSDRDATFFVVEARVEDGLDCARRHCRI